MRKLYIYILWKYTVKNLFPLYSPWFFSLIYYHHKIEISLHYYYFFCLFHLLAPLNITSGIAAMLLHPCSFTLAKKLSIFRTKRHVSRHGFLQSPLCRSNIYDVRFLFRILAWRRTMPTESLYMYSKPSLSFRVFVFCAHSCTREAIFFLFAFFSTHAAKADTLRKEQTKPRDERKNQPSGIENGGKRIRTRRRRR